MVAGGGPCPYCASEPTWRPKPGLMPPLFPAFLVSVSLCCHGPAPLPLTKWSALSEVGTLSYSFLQFGSSYSWPPLFPTLFPFRNLIPDRNAIVIAYVYDILQSNQYLSLSQCLWLLSILREPPRNRPSDKDPKASSVFRR